MTNFAPGFIPSEAEHCRVMREIIRPRLLTGISAKDTRFNDELTVHVRAGDIFQGPQSAWAWYRQPPLAFYKLTINQLLKNQIISRVRLVYEDRGNPCIAALEAYLRRFRTITATISATSAG